MRPSFSVFPALCLLLASGSLADKCVMRSHCGHDDSLDKPVPCKVSEKPKSLAQSDRQLFEEVCPDLAATTDLACCDVEQLRALKADLQQPIDIGMKHYPSCLRNFRNIFCHLLCSPKQSDFVKVVDSKDSREGKPEVTKAVYALSRKFTEGAYKSCENVRVKGIFKLMTFMCGWWCDSQKWFTYLGSTASEGGYSPYKLEFKITNDETVEVDGTELRPMNADVI
ncbi:NPC intracellular cholesterol transporter 1-like [Ornithodoros turicata]|uniref:NPC intracellular cholesterol transporter 1-like n=1 Tax=Ornithodoros turicata TaxID=34597 RepID=UPI003138C8C0